MSEKSKEKRKKVPQIMTSINDVEFKKKLFKEDNRREKFSDKYKTNTTKNSTDNKDFNSINSPKNCYSDFNHPNLNQNQNNISNLNVTNNTESNIRDFNRNVFNSCDTDENYKKVYEDKNGQKSGKKNNQEINYFTSCINNNNSIDFQNEANNNNNNYNDNAFINIRENEGENYLNNNSREFEQNQPSFVEEYKNPNSLINSNENINYNSYYINNSEVNNNSTNNIEEKNYNDRNNKSNNYHRTKHISANNVDLRKFYLNYNHLNTIGVYESTVSQVNTDEEDAVDRRSKYRLIDKNKINKSLNNTNFRYKKFNRSLPNIELIMKKFKQITPEEIEESRLRIWHLLQNFYNFIEESKIDPILDTFKSNEILKEFFVQRILELIANVFDSEKEMYIQKLLIDRREFENNFKDTQKTYEEVKDNQ